MVIHCFDRPFISAAISVRALWTIGRDLLTSQIRVLTRHLCLQVENEFGFVGPNEKYMKHLVETVRTVLGNDFIIYTTDPPPNIAKGSLAGDAVYRWIS